MIFIGDRTLLQLSFIARHKSSLISQWNAS